MVQAPTGATRRLPPDGAVAAAGKDVDPTMTGEVAAGEEVRNPPRECQLDHDGRYTFYATRAVRTLQRRRDAAPYEQTAGLC